MPRLNGNNFEPRATTIPFGILLNTTSFVNHYLHYFRYSRTVKNGVLVPFSCRSSRFSSGSNCGCRGTVRYASCTMYLNPSKSSDSVIFVGTCGFNVAVGDGAAFGIANQGVTLILELHIIAQTCSLTLLRACNKIVLYKNLGGPALWF